MKVLPRPVKGVLYRICRDCKKPFAGSFPHRRCPECFKLRQREQLKLYYLKHPEKLNTFIPWKDQTPEQKQRHKEIALKSYHKHKKTPEQKRKIRATELRNKYLARERELLRAGIPDWQLRLKGL